MRAFPVGLAAIDHDQTYFAGATWTEAKSWPGKATSAVEALVDSSGGWPGAVDDDITPPISGAGVRTTGSGVILFQLGRDRHFRVGDVVDDDEFDLELRSGRRLDPLRADDWSSGDVGDGSRGEVDLADHRGGVERRQGLSDRGLVVGGAGSLQRGKATVQQRHAGAKLLLPLLAGGFFVAVGKIGRRDSSERRLVGEGPRPVRAAGEIVAEIANSFDIRRKQTGLRDLRDLDHLGVALLRRLTPEGGKIRREREGVEDFALLFLEERDLRGVVRGAVLIRAGIDDGVAALGKQRREVGADGVAIRVIRIE